MKRAQVALNAEEDEPELIAILVSDSLQRKDKDFSLIRESIMQDKPNELRPFCS